MESGWMLATSNSTGCGGPLKVYDIRVGWIITSELSTVSRPIIRR